MARTSGSHRSRATAGPGHPGDQRTGITGHAVVYDHGGSTLSFEIGPGGRIYFSDFDGINKLVRV